MAASAGTQPYYYFIQKLNGCFIQWDWSPQRDVYSCLEAKGIEDFVASVLMMDCLSAFGLSLGRRWKGPIGWSMLPISVILVLPLPVFLRLSSSPLSMNSQHFSMTSAGLVELCVPSNITSIFLPGNDWYSLSAWCGGMSVSSSPWMKQICLFSGISLRRFMMFIWSMVRPASLLTLHWMQAKTQGKKQLKRQQQAGGRNLELDYLQSVERLEQAESAIMMSHSLPISRLTAPMLLPQPTTSYPFPFRKAAATSTSLLYDCPSVMNSPSVRFPQPLKSKQASPTPSGTQDRNSVPSKRLDPLPCKQRMTYRMASCLQRVSQKGTRNVSAVKRWPILREGLSISGLQMNLGGRMSMQASCSMMPLGEQCFIQKSAGLMLILVSLGCYLETLASLRVTFIRICNIIMRLSDKKGLVLREMPHGPALPLPVTAQLENAVYWHIFGRRYELDGWPAASKHIQQAPIEELHISDNTYPLMVKEIAVIAFPNLTTLSLIHNGLASIEPLVLMQAHRLEKLHLSRNYLRRVSRLRKANFPNLSILTLNDNPIVDCESLAECDFRHLQYFILECWDDSNTVCQQQSPLFKLQSRKLSYLGLKSAARIRRSATLAQLSARYKSINVIVCGD